ncbi:hypothetical protein barba126A_phanotate59 [Rheinheimera phage vB_RspM_barba_12-6A]|uniref:Uncharacterized protein n=3 Tax=Barbavirus TaxID=2733095 RepID=A0A4V1EZW5_9CAUD|nr:hypothetical protein Barba17S_gp052 [Rheinheimera phage vB_RspM_Barba17S]QCQ62171.1 hypothetical protein Barba20S_gp051 [Rheinheimera phage vB_RspM_Barba20S]QNO02002.1 hypothetical protein barba109A_phanotate10 [Rheinheimera phage vB_RspM_barba_10-9A]QNO02168.1 hypothetical protein barba109B_phanotate10 [Rheinheimera phage vB_RspM_barba_10-9B]QNO02483.1 hypothetical protein barba109C_phanotate162 [Rheinheimera phage vB_RspM_barba_10-9C]QNO02487.1 hypothetical protein barba109D_phanotate3 [R
MNNQITINDTDRAVADYLKANHIHFNSRYNGTKKAFDDKNIMDSWAVKIGLHEFEYYTGVGHRISCLKNMYKLTTKQLDGVKDLKELLGKDRLDNTVFKLSDGVSYAVSPTQASVLYCLLLDASGAEENFYDWCANFGYETDSRKAIDIHNACCDILLKMRKIFTSAQRAELSELLQDY